MDQPHKDSSNDSESLVMPAPTAAPMLLAMGAMLLAAGVVTHPSISVVGFVLAVLGLKGWLGELAPGEGHVLEELVPADQRPAPRAPVMGAVESLKPGAAGHRMQMPEKMHPYSAGALGGLVGGVVMAALAMLYGAVSTRGIWYPINLLSAMVMPSLEGDTLEQLTRFSRTALIVGAGIHFVGSLSAGLIYGVLLPMLPSRPVLWAGVVAPLLWSGAFHSVLGLANPQMSEHVDWPWFVASQIGFGLAAGFVVERFEKVQTNPPGGDRG
jgi:hypothetical protein